MRTKDTWNVRVTDRSGHATDKRFSTRDAANSYAHTQRVLRQNGANILGVYVNRSGEHGTPL